MDKIKNVAGLIVDLAPGAVLVLAGAAAIVGGTHGIVWF